MIFRRHEANRRPRNFDSGQVFLRMERHGKHIMCSTQHFSIFWPNQMGEAVKAKVATGEYPTENEVIRDGLLALMARDREMEGWLVV